MNRTDRLVAILLELQARGELRAEDLAATFEVSVRTVYRDLQALSEGGVPLLATPGKGYRLLEGYFLPPLAFTQGEAAVLALGGEFVRDRVDPELRQDAERALTKLLGVLPAERREALARWRYELLFASAQGLGANRHLGPLRRAIRERQVVRLLYHALRRPGPEQREVEPVRLVHLEEVWHLAAYCRLRQDGRMFRLDRIDRLQVLPERFDLEARHQVGPEGSAELQRFPEVRVRFDPEVERWVRERQPYPFLREETDAAGAAFVYALRNERELLRWLLSWGAATEVLSPAEFRARLAREARAILRRHRDTLDRAELSVQAPALAIALSGAPS